MRLIRGGTVERALAAGFLVFLLLVSCGGQKEQRADQALPDDR